MSKKMRLTLVTGIFPPDAGGPATYVPRLASALVGRGHRVTVITLSDSLGHDDTLYPFPVRRILRPQPKWQRMPQTVSAIANQARDSDLIFANGLFIESVPAAFRARKPLVMKIVGDWAWERSVNEGGVKETIDEFQLKRYGWRIEALKQLRSWVTRQAQSVLTPSHYLGGIVTGWGVHPERVRVIHNALEIERPRTQITDLPPFDGHTIVTVGRLVPWKGVDRLLAVVAQLPNLRLVILGDGPQRRELENLAANRQLNGRALFMGRVPQAQVGAYLQAADLFVLNSTYEGLPHIVLEAMAAGTPVIATDVGGTSEVVQHEENGLLVPSRDNEALRRSITRLLNDPSCRRQLAEQAKKDVVNRFSWPVLVDKTEKLLESYILNI